jgi:hypothetical protein
MSSTMRDYAIKKHGAVLQSNGSYLTRNDINIWFDTYGQPHRTDGPAVTYPDGMIRWYINDHRYDFIDWLKLTPITDEHKLLLRLQYDE